MRNPDRIKEITNELFECWSQYPDIRLGQLIENIYGYYNDSHCDMFDVEDDDWLKWIKQYKDDFSEFYIKVDNQI